MAELSRLEAREILHHLKPSCDPDVIQKLADIAQQPVVLHNEPAKAEPSRVALPPNAPPEVLKAAAASTEAKDQLPTDDSWKAKHEPWMDQIDPKTGKPYFTPDEIETVNKERGVALTAAHMASQQVPLDAIMPTPHATGGIERIPIGGKNSVGDTCVALRDPATGKGYMDASNIPADVDQSKLISIFYCGQDKEHGPYAAENESIRGCSKCFLRGMRQDSQREDGSDTTHSAREEQF